MANVTRWGAAWRGLLAADAAVWCLQEVRVPEEDVEEAQAQGKGRGMRLQPGPAHEGVHLLAVAHRSKTCEVRVEPMQGLSGDHPGRLQHAVVYLGRGRVLHIVNCYGYAGGRADLERNAALVLDGVTWLQCLGGVPALLVGDLNCKLEESGLEGPLGLAGWSDLLAHAGPTCVPSQGDPTRIDYALANRPARDMVRRVALRWDLGLATHAALELELDVAPPERAALRKTVQALDGPSGEGWTTAAAGATTQAVEQRYRERFQERLRARDLAGAWQTLELAMRTWLSARKGWAGPAPRQHAAVEWGADRPPTTGGGGEAAHAGADAALLRLRRLRGLRHAQGRPQAAAREVADTTLRALRRADAADAQWSAALAGLRPNVALPETMLERAEAEWKAARDAARTARRDGWNEWVQSAAANGKGRLYRWIKGGSELGEAVVPDPAEDTTAAEGAPGRSGWVLALRGGPAARMRFFEGAWRGLWQRQCNAQPGEEWLRESDGLPPFPARSPWTAGSVRAILRRMAARKKPGLDAWTVSELRLVPDALLGWIAELLEEVEAAGEWPRQLCEPEGLLLPKPGSGHGPLDRRPIWLLPMVYRLWAACRAQQFARWRLQWAGADVIAGAEELAWELALELEAAEALDEDIGGAALDWRKAYDHVDLVSAQAMLSRAGVPPWVLLPAFSAYRARRRLRVGRVLGEAWEPSSGLLPGCALAVFFLSVLTLPWLRRTGAVDERLRRRLYVDDFTLWMRGAAAEVGEAVSAALGLTELFEEALDWQLNRTKSAQFANSRALRQWLRQQEPRLAARTRVSDLGVVASAGRARHCAVGGARTRIAAGRFARIGRLPLPFKERCLLGAAAGTAAGLYGASCGRPPVRELNGLRAAARHAACRGGLRNAAELVFGVLSPSWRLDPEAVVVLAPLWAVARAMRRGRFPEALWRTVAGAAAAGKGRGNGPFAAALLSLRRLGLGDDVESWSGIPEAPAGWRPAARALPDTRRVLLAAWAAAECAAVAGRRADFGHLARGVDRWATRRLLEQGRLSGDAAGALRVVIAGGVITERVAAKWGRSPLCPHCGEAEEGTEHRFWQCPRWADTRRAALEGGDPAALRRRLPQGLACTGTVALDVRLGALAAEARCTTALPPLPPAVEQAPGTVRRRVWTDGACVHPRDPLLARAGWGLVLEGSEQSPEAERGGPVDGAQTAQRAELTAVVAAVGLAGGALEVVTDSRFVASGVAALRGGALLVDWAHADLWEAVAPHCRSGYLRARWVKGHTDEAEAALRGIAPADRRGNGRADAQAGRAAQIRLPAGQLVLEREAFLADVGAAQRVLAAVELAAIRANRAGDRADKRRVPRRRAWRGRRPAQGQRAGADPAGAAARPAAPRTQPPPPAAEACRALFAGRAWAPHAAARGPGFAACLQCGAVAAGWAALAARPCAGWAPRLQPRAAAVLLLEPVTRAGGQVGLFRAALERRLRERPRAPD